MELVANNSPNDIEIERQRVERERYRDGTEAMTARAIRRENVKHFRRLLETVTDEAERQKILKLLAQEQTKQSAAGDPIED